MLQMLITAAAAAAVHDVTAADSPLGAALSQLLARHGDAAAWDAPDTHSALVALSHQKRKMPPPTAVASRHDPTRTCMKALGKLCAAQRGKPSNPNEEACRACTKSNESELLKDGCTASALHEYCRAPKPVCPVELGAQVNATGLLPVDLFRPAANGSEESVPCDVATRMAINMSLACGGSIYFATACSFESTVVVPGGTSLVGGGNASPSEFGGGAKQTEISGPRNGPAFLVQHTTNVQFHNLLIAGHNTGVIVADSALIRFVNVAIRADYQGLGADNVNLTSAGCAGCNVVLGSNNTALVIENAFWVWAEDCSFYFYPMYRDDKIAVDRHDGWGQRPSVIIRGNTPGHFGINTVYLLHFGRCVLSGGAFQYQQLVSGQQWPGFYDFNWITTEVTATPLLDVQVAPGLHYFEGLQSVTIYDYSAADIAMPHYMRPYPKLTKSSVQCEGKSDGCPGLVAVTALNCSGALGCRFSGLTIISASGSEGMGYQVPAVRVWDGTVDSVTVFGSQLTGAADVLDGDNRPVGSWVSRSGGGFTIVGHCNDTAHGNAALTASGGHTHSNGNESDINNYIGKEGPTAGHGILLGESGERNARLAIETSGALRWGSGKESSFHSTLRSLRTNATEVLLPMIKGGGVVTASVVVEGAETADVVAATLSSIGDRLVSLTARVASSGRVLVLFKNEAADDVLIPRGTLRVVITEMA